MRYLPSKFCVLALSWAILFGHSLGDSVLPSVGDTDSTLQDLIPFDATEEDGITVTERVLSIDVDDNNSTDVVSLDIEIDDIEDDEDFDIDSFDVAAYYQQYINNSTHEGKNKTDSDFEHSGADVDLNIDVDPNDFDLDSFDVAAFYDDYLKIHNASSLTMPSSGLDPAIIADIQSRGSFKDLKDMVLEIVTHSDEQDLESPLLTDILISLSTSLGYEPWVLQFYLETFPSQAEDIALAHANAVQEVRERKVKVLVNLFLHTMLKDLKKGVPMEKILKSLGMEQHELDEALEAYNHPDVIEALENAEAEGANHASHLNDNNGSPGLLTRKLASDEVRENIDAQEAEHHETYRKRKMRRADILKSTKTFLVRVEDHKTFVHHHARRLTNCDDMTEEECDAETLDDMTDDLLTLSGLVETALNPILEFFHVFDKIEDKLGSVKLVLMTLSIALTACATLLDPYFAGIFTQLKNVVDLVKPKTDTIANKAADFEDEFIERWNSTLNGVTTMMDTFTTVTETAAEVGGFLVGVTQNQCAKSMVDGLLPGMIRRAQTGLGHFVDGAKDIVNVMGNLVSAIGGAAWKTTFTILKAVVSIGEFLAPFFTPLAPISVIVTTPLYFPWVDLKVPKVLGRAKCTNTDDKKFDKVLSSCWETDSPKWKLLVLPPFHMQKKCSNEDLPTFMTGVCKLPGRNMESRSRSETQRVCVNVNERVCARVNEQVCFTVRIKKCTRIAGRRKCVGRNIRKCDRVSVDRCSTVSVRRCDQVTVNIPYLACPSGTQWFVDKCYEGCPGDFTRDPVIRNLCNTPRRDQNVKLASCSSYDEPSNLGPLGNCWAKCPSGYTNLGILCVKAGTFKFTIQDVFEKAEKLLEDLTGKWVERVEDGLTTVLETALGFLTGLIDEVTGADFSFKVPNLSFNVDNLLPLNQINLNVPSLPSTNFDIAGNLLNKVTSKLPSNLISCGTDADCLLSQMNLPSVDEIMEKIENLFTPEDLEAVLDAFMEVVPSVNCKAWDETSIPLGDAFEALTELSCSACNVKVPICADMGTDFLDDSIQNVLNSQVQPIVMGGWGKIKEFLAPWAEARRLLGDDVVRRKLGGYNDVKKWQPILPITVPTSFGWDETAANQRTGKWEYYLMADHGHEGGVQGAGYMSGSYVALNLRVKIEFGFSYIDFYDMMTFDYNPFNDFGMKFGSEFELKFSTTGDINALLDRRRRWVEKIRNIDESDIYLKGDECFELEDQYLYDVDGMAGDGTKLAYHTSLDDVLLQFVENGDFWYTVCKPLEEARDMVWEEYKKYDCEPEDMLKTVDPQNEEERRKAILCVKYWYDTKREVEELIAKYYRLKDEAYTGIAVAKPGFFRSLWGSTKEAVKYTLHPKNWPLDSYYFLNMAVSEIMGDSRGLRPRMWVRMVWSPVDFFEIGPTFQFDFDDDGLQLYGLGVGSFTIDSAKVLRRERQLMQSQAPLKDKDGNEIERGVGTIPIVSLNAGIWCHVDFAPGKGKIRDGFWCPGFAT
ncbi:expressed unknown protein [Seminavis robusta]|uniref:Uncharacterized protein n=1 Tax=Seminavis robusta TaxID=568900 RepID=A0A9N8HSQ4_9STRA|nr:expressed unknown protein [Seminavis robusta]|eukprot:Sro1414_g270650.1 n/a (1504) ;mRNA; f:8744-13958